VLIVSLVSFSFLFNIESGAYPSWLNFI